MPVRCSSPSPTPSFTPHGSSTDARPARGVEENDDTADHQSQSVRPVSLHSARHPRDHLDVFPQRIATTLIEDKPDFVYANQGAAVVEQRYNEQDSLTVAAAISLNADALARLLKTVPAEGWERPATRRGYESF